MQPERRKTKLKTFVVFGAIFIAVGVFSLLTMGAFATTNETLAKQAAEGDLKGSKYLALLSEDFVKLTQNNLSLRERLPGSGGKQICGVPKNTIQQLSLMEGVELGKTTSANGLVHYVVIGGEADVNDVLDAMDAASSRVKCIQVKNSRAFFLTSPVHVS